MKHLIAACLLVISAPLFADGIRCKTNLVNTGDLKSTVLQKCGQPLASETVGYQISDKGNQEIGSKIEELTYSFSKGSYHILRFENGRLTTVTFERNL